ncbi:MAG: tetratricopeptide repeat protein, partial [Gemmataceae bacterium]|nr:tetratricopeptide repeat protein [Gemmataceae bacterium]
MTTVAALLTKGLAAHQAGRLADAEACYRRALRAQPGQQDALHLLAVAALQAGRLTDALALARQATDAAPGQPTFWNTRGVAERTAGDLAAAAASFRRAGTLTPAYADAWANLAATHEQAGDPAAEDDALVRLLAVQPGNVRAWGRRGVLAYLQQWFPDAEAHFAEAARLAPDDPELWSNLGAVQLQRGRLAEAEASQSRALSLRPDFLGARNNLGNVLVAQSRWAEAVAVLEDVVRQAPADPNGWVNLGHALKGLERYAEARDAYERVLAMHPGLPVALLGLGDTLQGMGDLHGAIACYEGALVQAADNPDLHEHYGVALQGLGRIDEALAQFRACLARDPDRARVHSAVIFALDLSEGGDPEAHRERERYNARFGGRAWTVRHANNPDPDRPLRVGYVSADFRHHSAGFLVLPVLKAHDRAQVQVYCYSGVSKPDYLTERFRALADVWHDMYDLDDDALEALIRRDEIDVLVDLSGHSAGNRLTVFAREPAPVQVTAWGYATGTGLDTMHYFMADPIVVPPEARAAYFEEVVNLPSVLCYEPPDAAPPVAPPPSLANGYVTFGAFNRMEKVSPGVRDAWAAVMLRVPDARLIVKTGRVSTDAACQQLVDDLVARGVARERIELRGNTSHQEHLAAHGDIDILLDTFPHGGGVTSVEALLMGV